MPSKGKKNIVLRGQRAGVGGGGIDDELIKTTDTQDNADDKDLLLTLTGCLRNKGEWVLLA
jgi:hypothetical protein